LMDAQKLRIAVGDETVSALSLRRPDARRCTCSRTAPVRG
jgi:hypothetical protein